MITCLVFSKNRPLQLDLCINSIRSRYPDCDQIYVIEKYDDEYVEALDILKKEHHDIGFIKQSSSIYEDCLNVVTWCKNNHICLMTDDDLFYNTFSTTSYNEIFDKQTEICCISLRLGMNICERSHLGMVSKDIPFKAHEYPTYLIIPKTDNPYGSYWSYSHSIDGHIFTRESLLVIFDELSYLDKKYNFKQSPNELESQMQRYWPLSCNFILCPKTSCVVNSPNNRVSSTHNENMSGEHFNYDSRYLLDLYISGKRIELDKIQFPEIKCPHTEINILSGLP